MEIYQMRYFQAVATRGSYSAAARYAHVSQPSLSIQIRRLEEELGRRVFRRSSKGIHLTPAGERFLETVNSILEQLREMRQDIHVHETGQLQVIRLGVQPLLAATILPPVLKRFLATHTQTRFIILEHPNYLLPELLLRGEVHFCLMTRLEHHSPAENARPLLRCPYGVFSRNPQLLQSRRSWTLPQLASRPLLVFRDPNCIEERIRRLAMQMRKHPNILFSSDHALTVLEMCACGVGIAVLPMIVRESACRLKLHHRRMIPHNMQSEVVMVSREDKLMPVAASQCMDFMTEQLRGLAF